MLSAFLDEEQDFVCLDDARVRSGMPILANDEDRDVLSRPDNPPNGLWSNARNSTTAKSSTADSAGIWQETERDPSYEGTHKQRHQLVAMNCSREDSWVNLAGRGRFTV